MSHRLDATPAIKPIEISPDLKALMRRLKLGQLLDTLPEAADPGPIQPAVAP